MKTVDYCPYPPRLADDVEVVPQTGSLSPRFIAGSASAGRYLLLGQAEKRVLDLIDGERAAGEFGYAADEIARFLAKLDEVGRLAGRHSAAQGPIAGNEIYVRWKLFNPEKLF